MKIRNLFLLSISIILLNACYVGDNDDLAIPYEPTLIELVCQTPEISNFCELMYRTRQVTNPNSKSYGQPIAAWEIQFSGRSGTDAITGTPCASNVETVFAPNNEAFGSLFASIFPRWINPEDSTLNFDAIDASIAADSSAADTITNIILHHIYNDPGTERGAKLYVEIEDPECSEQEIIPSNQNPYRMMDGNGFIFINVSGNVFAQSLATNFGGFSQIVAPDMATTDGAIYILEKVLGPYDPF